jgi:hypothetical protein
MVQKYFQKKFLNNPAYCGVFMVNRPAIGCEPGLPKCPPYSEETVR